MTRSPMRLLHTVRESVRSPGFYDGLAARPFSFSLKYFLTLNLFLAFLLTVVYSVSLVPAANSFLRGVGPAVLDHFPDELVITVKGGEASANVTEPYFISLSPQIRERESEWEGIGKLENLLVIDTKNEFSLERFSSYRTPLLLMKDALVVKTGENKIEIQKLASVPDVTIDKARVLNLVSALEPLVRWVAPLVVFVLFVGLFAFLNFRLAYLVLGAFLVWGIGRVKKRTLSYGKSYQIALHAVTLAVLVDAARMAFVLPKIPFLFTVLFLAAAWMNLKKG